MLDLNAGTGLLTWEALRRVPEGGVWALVTGEAEAEALREQAARLPELERPAVLQGSLPDLPELLAFRGEAGMRFDAIIGRSALTPPRAAPGTAADGRETLARLLAGLLQPGGGVSLAEPVPRHTQRLYALVDLSALGAPLAQKVRDAEEAIYATADDPLVNWDAEDLRASFAATGFEAVQVNGQEMVVDARLTPALVARWFNPAVPGERPSYSQRLATVLDPAEMAAVQALYERSLTNQTVPWRSVMAYVMARREASSVKRQTSS